VTSPIVVTVSRSSDLHVSCGVDEMWSLNWQVRWADIEQRKDQMRRRELGFVIGQTDWAKMTDDSYADRALNRTKYI